MKFWLVFYFLRLLNSKILVPFTYKTLIASEIVRTRDQEVLSKCDILVDVGATYDPKKYIWNSFLLINSQKFDHHQDGFLETFTPSFKTRLSSAGLIYKHFGKDLIKQFHKDLNENDTNVVFEKLYEEFIEAIDAYDNGIDQYDSEVPPKFKQTTHLT